jgi:hypothetical protein
MPSAARGLAHHHPNAALAAMPTKVTSDSQKQSVV